MRSDYNTLGFITTRWASAQPESLVIPSRAWGPGPRRLAEAFRGSDIVAWQGKIETQLERFANEADEARNHDYANKIRAFLRVWRDNPFDGSINVETINTLLGATQMPSVDDWRFQNYFASLRSQLRRLKASTEELPFNDEVPADQRAPMSAPPSSFGAEEMPSDIPPVDPSQPPAEGAEQQQPADQQAVDAAAQLGGEPAPEDEMNQPRVGL